MSETVEVTRNEHLHRYELHVDGELAGFAVAEPDAEGREVFSHTEVDDRFAGRGLGAVLVGRALADEAERGTTVVPVCSFVVHYLQGREVPGLIVHGSDAGAAR